MEETRRAVAAGLTAGALWAAAPARAQIQSVAPAASASPAALAAPSAGAETPAAEVAAAADPSRRMTVPVMLNGAGPFAFVVDTGSNRSVVSDVLAQRLGLPAGEPLTVHTATGVVSTASVRIANLSVGSRRITGVQAPVLAADNLGALGMLGIDAVADQRLLLDFRHQRMSITAGRSQAEDLGLVVVRARSKYGQLLLVDAAVEGIPLYVIIDTGGEVTLGNLALRALLARRRSGYPTPVMVTSVTGAEVVADLSFMPRVKLGDMTVLNLQVAYADMYAFEKFGLQQKPAMLLGMSTLRVFDRVSVDFAAREVRFLVGAAV